ncbi:MAG: alginate lyase family protein [Cyclobacterium sp.]|uniref:heparinase II/III domain-containing protein n=1 Tax=Cyclobacterium sp. TaxID=1966343 RepID=UPI0039705B23
MKDKLIRIGQVIRTISHLKPIQVAYQLKNRWIKPKPLKRYDLKFENTNRLSFFDLPQGSPKLEVIEDQFNFNFLNLPHTFKGNIEWDYQSHGKLWNYNLQYLDFLKQNDLSINTKIQLIQDIYEKLWFGNLRLEPYPASLRIMNVIRFLSSISEEALTKNIEQYLIAEINYLSNNLEYHLLGNHLLENGFALLMGGNFFQNQEFIGKAKKLLYEELEEQVLEDGAHFELSPMYHQIILFRILEAMSYLQPLNSFHYFLERKASSMVSWLKVISFKDGSIPHFNDSCDDIALGTNELLRIGNDFSVEPNTAHVLKASGYRKFKLNEFELVADFHGISPTYQPGHAHADTFSFCLNHREKQIIVDPGISTYTISQRRDWERSTNAHNTIEANNTSSSEVWAGFRVGRRARVKILDDQKELIRAVHDGYNRLGITIERSVRCEFEKIVIADSIKGNIADKSIFLHIHFHPNVKIVRISDHVFLINKNLRLEFEGDGQLRMEKYQFCGGYNQYNESNRLKIAITSSSFNMTIIDQV